MKKILSSIIALALMLAIMAAAVAEGEKDEEERFPNYKAWQQAQLLDEEEEKFPKFKAWQQAQLLGEEGDRYDELAASLKSIKALYDNGLTGTNKFKAAVGLMTGKDIAKMTNSDIVQAYEEVFPKIKSYFKEGSEANTGIQNFLKAVQKAGNEIGKEWVTIEKSGYSFDFDASEVAEELEINKEIIYMIFGKMRDYGSDVSDD